MGRMDECLRPIYSLRENDVEIEDDLDRFVIGLAEVVDGLQDAESTGDYDLLDELAMAMSADAARLGYPDLEKVARSVRRANEEVSKQAVQESLVELTEVARRIRLGHRGAA